MLLHFWDWCSLGLLIYDYWENSHATEFE
jgi:hypothetical protein